ncbi:MAG TPA: OmpA family protein, partial [Chryseosolibacter sp.]|nr:OmpA family protein [Chryseosolibacter sp.]
QKEQPLPINNEAFSTGHPATAPDGKLYFVSDKPGGYGGTDIYYLRVINGVWSESVNLGPTINTSGNEMFPFIDEKGDLYFASNTHAGMGGLDIFHARNENGNFANPRNLGHPVNSSRDDFGFVLKGAKGFFTSNRGDDPKDDNIYEVTINKMKSAAIRAVDENGAPLENFELSIAVDGSTQEHNIETVYVTSLNGEQTYTITGSKKGYQAATRTFSSVEIKRMVQAEQITLTLPRARKKIIFELQSTDGKKLTGGMIDLRNDVRGEVSTIQSNENGIMSAELVSSGAWAIHATCKDYKNLSTSLTPERLAQMADNEVLILTMVPATALFDKNEIGQTIELEIKYDVNKATIRPDAARELDKLVVFMKKNPGVKVELGSHTDSRGSNEANLKLSQRRAESAVRYLVGKGVSTKRLIPIGYGEDDLKVKDAVSEEDHQHNRRTTVKIVAVQ